MAYPVFDNHVHLQRKGRFLDAVREYERKGGTGFMLVALPPEQGVLSDSYFTEMFEEGAKLRQEAVAASKLDILLAIGPYPVTLLELVEQLGIEAAEQRMVEAAELAGSLVREGRADAIGEIGRPHFDVSPAIMAASNRIMEVCMMEARSAGCPVILHTEDATPESLKNISAIANHAGIDRGMVVKHHCTDLITDSENSGIFPSVKASRDLVFSSIRKGTRFMMETDYIDDPSKPGAVLGIGTVPKRTREILEGGLASEEDIWKISYENPASLYGKDRFRRTA